LTVVIEQIDRSGYPVLPVVDEGRHLLGVVNLEEVHVASRGTFAQSFLLAADLMRTDVQPLHPGDSLDRAQELFVDNDLLALPVVDEKDDHKVVGLVKRYDVASAYLRHVQGQPQPNA
jgi:CBS domain-containing protein